MNVSDFDYDLPEELIAEEPAPIRDESRLLVLRRATGELEHSRFDHLGGFLTSGDLLVLNNTRVFPARLLGQRVPSGGAVECLLLRQLPTPNAQLPNQTAPQLGNSESGIGSSVFWDALMHPGQKLKPGARVVFRRNAAELHGEVLERRFHGRRTLRLWTENGSVAEAIDAIGHVPLPPYIKRSDLPADAERYQTVYSQVRSSATGAGSVAAPTAGLHFTDDLLRDLERRGIERADVTLNVGYGTFKPVRADRVEDHVVDAESFAVGPAAAAALTRALRGARRVIAVGTTTVRTLESLNVTDKGAVEPASGETGLFIYPGRAFHLVSALITNFHLPRSSLLMLVAAFAGRDQVLHAYREAIAHRYRFYSYGDAMLIL